MPTCAIGGNLYFAWVALCPQVPTGEDDPVVIARAVNTKTAVSEAARAAYEAHVAHCPQCKQALMPKWVKPKQPLKD